MKKKKREKKYNVKLKVNEIFLFMSFSFLFCFVFAGFLYHSHTKTMPIYNPWESWIHSLVVFFNFMFILFLCFHKQKKNILWVNKSTSKDILLSFTLTMRNIYKQTDYFSFYSSFISFRFTIYGATKSYCIRYYMHLIILYIDCASSQIVKWMKECAYSLPRYRLPHNNAGIIHLANYCCCCYCCCADCCFFSCNCCRLKFVRLLL